MVHPPWWVARARGRQRVVPSISLLVLLKPELVLVLGLRELSLLDQEQLVLRLRVLLVLPAPLF